MLDFSQVSSQIDAFTQESARALPYRRNALTEATTRLLHSGNDWPLTAEKIAAGKTSWLLANWIEPPYQTHPLPERPFPYTVLATDGSQIVSDRHDIASCYLINIGSIAIRYGGGMRSTLTSHPELQFPEDDLLMEMQGEVQVIAPRRLAIRRLLAELQHLVSLMRSEQSTFDASHPVSRSVPLMGLVDGSLILWPLESETEEFKQDSLHRLHTILEDSRQLCEPIIGYISRPASRDVINSLRVSKCPHPVANCDRYCPRRAKPKPLFLAPDCAGTEQITDADLFFRHLQPGERSAVFGSQSKILNQYPSEHRIVFFYLHTGREVARVEIPAWVATDYDLLARTHAHCYDQAQKGDGYPLALAEAHEQAVIRTAERTAFFQLLERAFVRERLPVSTTGKSISKRARRV